MAEIVTKTSIKASLLLLYSLFFLSACENAEQVEQFSGFTMGTSYHVKLVLPDELDTKAVAAQTTALLQSIDNSMSSYKSESEISRFNRAEIDHWFAVSKQSAEVVAIAQGVAKLSRGALDITLAPLINLWGFGPTYQLNEEQTIPDGAEIDKLRARVGFEKLQVRIDPPALRKTAAVTVDVSAVAKGYAVDQIAEYLNSQGVTNYLVEIGGELRASGVKAEGKSWVIAIEAPVPHKSVVQVVLALDDKAVATSGDYRNYFERNGRRYSHTIDPATGKPITHQLASVTVIETSTARADALATAINVMGPEAGLRFAEKHGIAVYLVIKSKAGFVTRYTEDFARYMH